MKTIIYMMLFCAAACFAQTQEGTTAPAQSPATSSSPATRTVRGHADSVAMAQLEPKSGSEVTGLVAFRQVGDEVLVTGMIKNLKPGKHGLHIHDKGDCSSPDAASAGPHFNPTAQHHGGPATTEHHAGDLGNIEATSSGIVQLNSKVKLSLSGKDSIIGKSVVVHEGEDDLKTDPAGNSGARVACGEIKSR
jgi:superoxide dismutase, Cu-Zn family